MENTQPKNKTVVLAKIIQIVLVVVSIILSVYFYRHFPARVPIHWDVSGNVNSWGSRSVAAFVLPAILVVLFFLFEWLPMIDPRKDRYAEFTKVYTIIKTSIMSVLFAIYLAASLSGLGYPISIGFWVPFVIGLLFIVLGNYFGKIRNNYFVGIRTPWTLANEEVWNKTHRLGGKLFMLGGIMLLCTGFEPVALRLPLFIVVIVIAAVLPIGYSYILYKRLQK
jgi:uncharacterized membrane protein